MFRRPRMVAELLLLLRGWVFAWLAAFLLLVPGAQPLRDWAPFGVGLAVVFILGRFFPEGERSNAAHLGAEGVATVLWAWLVARTGGGASPFASLFLLGLLGSGVRFRSSWDPPALGWQLAVIGVHLAGFLAALGIGGEAWLARDAVVLAPAESRAAALLIMLTAVGYAYVIARAENTLRRHAIFEPLTGLYTREYVIAKLEEACRGLGGLRPPFSVLMLDLDDFKAVNDRHGHQAGDWALAEASSAIRQNLRNFDLAGRFGGEEFIVVLADTLEDDALAVAQRLCRAVAERGRTYSATGADGVTLELTVSIGAACFGPGRETVEELVEAADRAMYWAKIHGKNQAAGYSLLLGGGPDGDRRRGAGAEKRAHSRRPARGGEGGHEG